MAMPTSQHRNTKDLSAGWPFLNKYYKGAIRHVSSPSFEHYIKPAYLSTPQYRGPVHWLALPVQVLQWDDKAHFQPFLLNTTLNHEGPERTITARNRKTSLFRTLCFI
ncbi:hypothetical protein DPMN_090234 [Dreissena polymorpha]|uniref:Uncharacterized protein n=1 Tax=Dreissena polymorpha TaxID=45954 RepID=A0A9D4KY85_DREPO|nr:hypothetical protein DPMN_090234 [Dreissena polymorpha]